MRSNEKTVVDEMIDIFDIGPSDKNESDDYDSPASNDSNSKPEFDDLSVEVYDSIESIKTDTPVLESKKEEIIVDSKETIEVVEKNIEEPTIVSNEEQEASEENMNVDDINVDDIFSKSSSSLKETVVDDCIDKEASTDNNIVEDEVETLQSEEAKIESSPEKTLETTKEQPSKKDIPFDSAKDSIGVEELPTEGSKVNVEDNVRIIDGKFQWLLNCPNEKFSFFYKSKAESLRDMLPQGQIPFDRYTNDLKSSTVNLSAPTHDLKEVCELMNSLQQHRDRAVAIAIHVDSQYYVWERFTDIMKGVLARMQYEKPILKQEGVVFVHLRDMELYHSKLRAIHHLCSSVLKNLDMAWETLSRRVTISLGEREVVDRMQSQGSFNKNKQITSSPSTPAKPPTSEASLDDFDELGGSTPIKSDKQKSGAQEIDW